MNGAVIDAALEDMQIIVDTREQPTEAFYKRFADVGIPVVRKALSFGDYSAQTVIDGKTISLENIAVVERKMSLDEISGNFTKSRERFAREFGRATLKGANVWLIVENATWENLYNGRYKTRFNPKSFVGSVLSWAVRYNIKFQFCKPETTGKLIADIMRYELRAYLETLPDDWGDS